MHAGAQDGAGDLCAELTLDMGIRRHPGLS
jgi:hypothetical protein